MMISNNGAFRDCLGSDADRERGAAAAGGVGGGRSGRGGCGGDDAAATPTRRGTGRVKQTVFL